PSVSTLFSVLHRHPPAPPLFPYTTLFRSDPLHRRPERMTPQSTHRPKSAESAKPITEITLIPTTCGPFFAKIPIRLDPIRPPVRSEEHTSELQSRSDLVCRLLLEKKKLAN